MTRVHMFQLAVDFCSSRGCIWLGIWSIGWSPSLESFLSVPMILQGFWFPCLALLQHSALLINQC